LIPFNEPFAIAMMLVATITSFSGLLQVVTIQLHPEESEAVSTFYWVSNFIQNLMWSIYGLMIGDLVVISSSFITAVVSVIVLAYIQVKNDKSWFWATIRSDLSRTRYTSIAITSDTHNKSKS